MTTTISMNTTATIKSVNIVSASKELTTDVVSYMEKFVFRSAVKKEYQTLIDAENEKIEVQKKCMETMKQTAMAEQAESLFKQVESDCLVAIARMEDDRDQYIQDNCKFAKTQAHKDLEKALKDGVQAESAIIAFFKNYNLHVENTVFLNEIANGAGNKWSWDKFCESEGVDGRTLNNGNLVKQVYYTTYTYMVRAGLIKPVSIPAIIREEYYEKIRKQEERANRKARKERKKAERANSETKKDLEVVTSVEDVNKVTA